MLLRSPMLALAVVMAVQCVAQEPARPTAQPTAAASEWRPMFDGKSLTGWKETQFTNHGEVRVEDGSIILGRGYITGINWTGDFPVTNYEVRMEATRLQGSDFFAGITFPVYDSFCTWINGGWGGSLVGLSSLDGADAAENETTQNMHFEQGRWYALRLQVTDRSIRAWIDEKPVIQVETAGLIIDLRPGEIELSKPLGIASYDTRAAIRKIEYRLLPTPPVQ